MKRTFPKRYALRLLAALEGAGHDLTTLFRQSGVDLDAIRSGPDPMPVDLHYALVRAAIAATGREDLGLLAGARISLLDHGSLGLLVAASGNLEKALRRAMEFVSLVSVDWDAKLDFDGDPPQLRITFLPHVGEDLHEYYFDEFVGSLLQIGQELERTGSWIKEIQVPRPETPERRAKAQDNDLPFRFGADQFCMVFDRAYFDVPLVSSDRLTAQIIEKQCMDMMRHSTRRDSQLDRIRHLIIEALPQVPKESMLAQRLNTSERSLRRYCASNGTSVREIVMQVRMTIAENYVRNSQIPFEEISYLVGYGSPASFFRAYRNWHDTTPGTMRSIALSG